MHKPRTLRPGQPLLISGRFRSGSTLLWQLLRASADTVAFYEPDHDGLRKHIAHTQPMASHVGVSGYWDEYRGLEALLAEHHQAAFGAQDFLLEASAQKPALLAYLNALIQSAAPRRAVLKLNRFSLRLPWLRAHLADARILHLSRDPRAAWWSSRRHLAPERVDAGAEVDAYDLLQWTLDLAPTLPFLAGLLGQPSYALHYAIWRLADLAGERLADVVIHLERDLFDPSGLGLERLARAGIIKDTEQAHLARLITPPAAAQLPRSDEWFAAIEAQVEGTLAALGLVRHFGLLPLSRIRALNIRAWRAHEPLSLSELLKPLLMALSEARAEQTRLLGIVRELEAR